MSKLYWSGEGLIFGQMPTPREQDELAQKAPRVLEWWRDLHRRHNDLRKYARKGRFQEECARNVLTFWREWFLYEHGPPSDDQREWLAVARPVRLAMIRMLAGKIGKEGLAQVNELALHAILPCFGMDEEGLERGSDAREQFVPRDGANKGRFWWPFEMPTPQEFQTIRPPNWSIKSKKAQPHS